MKKFWLAFAVIALVSACGEKKEETQTVLEEGQVVEIKPEFNITFDNMIHTYNTNNTSNKCDASDEAVCAVDLTVKCTINPKMDVCDNSKMPKFIFMEDESLGRPTEVSFEVDSVKPIDATTVEVNTLSKCNGNWFGLCNGRVIYVLSNKTGAWIVKDIYAIENM